MKKTLEIITNKKFGTGTNLTNVTDMKLTKHENLTTYHI